jgi:carbamate kinase
MDIHQEKIAVVALGGNAITREFEEGNIYQQFANTRKSLFGVADLIEQGYRVAITHGNGPQIGNALIRIEETRNKIPPIPLGVLVADLEGGMGYMIEQTLQNKLLYRGVKRDVITILAQMLVDKDDPSILNPAKFVGPFYKKEEIKNLKETRNYTIKEDAAKVLLKRGHFPPGSMGPKIEAAINFLEIGGDKVIITAVDKMSFTINGKTGTLILP